MSKENPEYTVVRRRDDEYGNPRYSAIDFADEYLVANKKANKNRSDNKFGDIIFFLKTEYVYDIYNEEFNVSIVTQSKKVVPVLIGYPFLSSIAKRRGQSIIGSWEGEYANAYRMLDCVMKVSGSKKALNILLTIGRSLNASKEFVLFLDILNEFTNSTKNIHCSMATIVDFMRAKGFDIDVLYKYTEEYPIAQCMVNGIVDANNVSSHFLYSLEAMAIQIDRDNLIDVYFKFSDIVRSVMPLKELLLDSVTGNYEGTFSNK